jgi:hypothetical protein
MTIVKKIVTAPGRVIPDIRPHRYKSACRRPLLLSHFLFSPANRQLLLAACLAPALIGLTQCSSSQHAESVSTTPPVTVVPDTDTVSVATYHYDNASSGIQPQEASLTPANVKSSTFGKLFSVPVDGQVFAQPLIAANITMADGQPHTLLFVATQNDSVYAFDADQASTSPFWKVSLLQSGEKAVPSGDLGVTDPTPVVGITGTPVLDLTNQVLYVVSKSKGSNGSEVQRLHALKFKDGSETDNAPVTIAASVPGTASDAVGGQVVFNTVRENQRSALSLNNGTVWIEWASHGDIAPYHGWLMGYNSSDLTKQTYVFNDTPNGGEGGIWMSSGGPSFDSAGNMYLNTGNGTFDPASGNYSSSALRLTPGTGTQLNVADYFSPFDQEYLSSIDADFGIASAVLLPDQAGSKPHLMVTADKNSIVYLIDRDNMGKYNSTTNNVVQAFPGSPYGLKQNLLFFNNTLYVSGDSTPMYAYPFNPSTQLFTTTPTSATANSFVCQGNCYIGGSSPVISANGTQNPILWTLDNTAWSEGGPAVLHAYDPANLATEFYNSNQAASNRDQAGNAVKFLNPVIANGRVYVAGNGSVTVYGLLN